MRSMMVTTEGEDYMLFAEARGLRSRKIFTQYGLRNAMDFSQQPSAPDPQPLHTDCHGSIWDAPPPEG